MNIKAEIIKIAKTLDFKTFKANVLKELKNFKVLKKLNWEIRENNIKGEIYVETKRKDRNSGWKEIEGIIKDDIAEYLYDWLASKYQIHNGSKLIRITSSHFWVYKGSYVGDTFYVTVDLPTLYDIYSKTIK